MSEKNTKTRDDAKNNGAFTPFEAAVQFALDNMDSCGKAETTNRLKRLSPEGAAKFLKQHHWPEYAAHIPDQIAIILMDISLNHGNLAARKIVQRVTKATIDGIIGKKTLAAINAANTDALAKALLSAHGRAYANLRHAAMMQIWMLRLFNLYDFVKGLEK